MTYNPVEYWTERGKTYINEARDKKIQEQALIAYLDKLTFHSVFELGCGYGRITKLIKHYFDVEIVACDISPDAIAHVKGDAECIVGDFLQLEIRKKFDLVLAVEVLMHIRPTEIMQAISKLKALSKKHVVTIDWYVENYNEYIAPHNFLHPYPKLLDCKPQRIRTEPQCLFSVDVEAWTS